MTTHSSSQWHVHCASLTVVVLGLGGCQGLTSVDAPDVVQPNDYATAAGASALAVGAVTRFHTSFGGIGGSSVGQPQVVASGLMADELLATSTSDREWDGRNPVDPSQRGELYGALHETRQAALTAIATFQRVAPDSTARIGQLFALVGYSSLFFGENFCAGVPLSHRDANLQPVYGEPLTTTQLLDSAVVAFDSALFYGADSARIAHLARVGRGRALLNLGRFNDASAAVASVPTDYLYGVTFLATGDGVFPNVFFFNGVPNGAFTVPEQEGTNGLNWQTAADPRVLLLNQSPPLVGELEFWVFTPYQAEDSPIALASGIEGRLIGAEAALQAGDAGSWLEIHNALRATVGLTELDDPGTPDARVTLHFRERGFWLFLTGHRLGDLRRLVRQYGRDQETVFPTGVWRDGIRYGTATNMAPPAAETNNPQYTGCLNRDA